METNDALNAFGALSQDTRLQVLRLLIAHEPDGLAAGELARLIAVAPNTLSAHLNVLTHAALITSERRSRSIIYNADLGKLELLLLFLLEDCCNGRPDLRAQLIAGVTKRLSAKTRGR
jgi:DNA-binding transcriptional ArsR family regulator